jgi:PmbA protein
MVTKRLLEIAEETVELASKHKVDHAQADAYLVHSALTRYANSQIHQNVASKRGGVAIKVVVGKKIGTLLVNTLMEKEIEESIKKAVKIAQVAPPNKEFKGLPTPAKWNPIKGAFDKNTAECTPDFRAEKVVEAIDNARSKSRLVQAVAGFLSTDSLAYAVANSAGISAWAEITSASMQTTVISKSNGSQGFGSEEQYSRRIRDIDPMKVSTRAAEKSVKSINPRKIPVGEYEVVLSPRAVAGIFSYLGFIGFSATSFQDGQSFVKYNLNKQVFDKKLDVIDDPRDPRTLYSFSVDGEGVPKGRTQLIEKGRVSKKSICYDSMTAGKEKGAKSTGHAPPPVFGFMGRPVPLNVLITPGDASEEEMIRETRHGIFITRFHYINPVEPTKAILTGLTRDGTFIIEKGEIGKPVVNLRYTDSMLSALKEAPMIGKKLEIIEETTAPSMKLQKLRFTGITQF